MNETPLISVVIPACNARATLGACLEAVFASRYGNFEVIVVDDGSVDGCGEIARAFACTLVRREVQGGAGAARNTGTAACRGEAIFFTDADCLLKEDSLAVAASTLHDNPRAIVGGTYTPLPHDPDFFSCFQSILIHFFETKRHPPDYIASHAMVMAAEVFRRSGGFSRSALYPDGGGVEDVAFSHRLRRNGHPLVLDPGLQVRHFFQFSFRRSLVNAWKKARHWTLYSLLNNDLLADSGAAARELKANVVLYVLSASALLSAGLFHRPVLLLAAAVLSGLNLYLNRRVAAAFYRRGPSFSFAVKAVLYYFGVYPIPVGAGALAALLHYFKERRGERQRCIPR